MPARQVLVIPGFHQDVVWRRPPEQQVAIRQAQYDSAWDALLKYPEFRLELDQAWNVREYLQNNPHRADQLRRFLEEGRVEITGGEETIPDTNMPGGEGLIRNLFLGRLWYEETLGVRPTVGNLDDAFGLSAQLPQILTGFGYTSLRDCRTPGLDASLAPSGLLWEGLDGSRLFYYQAPVNLSEHTHICNLPLVYAPPAQARRCVEEALSCPLPTVYLRWASEEDLITDEIVRLILDHPRPSGTTMRFGLPSEVAAALAAQNPDPPVVQGEFNPSQPGTHLSRIRLKQAYRAAEWGTLTAEVAAACASAAGGRYPRRRLAGLWRLLSFVQFHDALCGCHIESVNRLAMRRCRQVSRGVAGIAGRALQQLTPAPDRGKPGVALFNPLLEARHEPLLLPLPAGKTLADAAGQPLPAERHGDRTLVLADLPPLGLTTRPLVAASVPAPRARAQSRRGDLVEVGDYRLQATDDSLTLEHRGWQRTLISGCFPEVRFRHEDGTLWDERLLGTVFDESAGDRQLVAIEEGPVSTRLCWRGEVSGDPQADPLPPGWAATRQGRAVVFADLEQLLWEKELVFYAASPRIDCRIRLEFTGRNTEILAGFPLQLDLRHTRMLYEIPCGVMDRRPYYEVPFDSPEAVGAPVHLAAVGGRGAWPAQTWVAYQDDQWGMALANQGTGSHRIMNGRIEVGILRSPTTLSSGFHPPRAARENGHHEFAFALLPFRGDWTEARAWELGHALNAPPLAELTEVAPVPVTQTCLQLAAEGVVLSALKRAERREGFILRTFETRGKRARGALETALPVQRVWETNLMEEPQREVAPDRLEWRPWEIKTLLLER